MDNIIVGIGQMGAATRPAKRITTYALGSCVAAIAFDPEARFVGLVHIALPSSSINPEKARVSPGHFADTGLPALLKYMRKLGANGNTAKYFFKLAGGASVSDPNNVFNVGQRNITAITRILKGMDMRIAASNVGERISRTVKVDVCTGRVVISSPGLPDWNL